MLIGPAGNPFVEKRGGLEDVVYLKRRPRVGIMASRREEKSYLRMQKSRKLPGRKMCHIQNQQAGSLSLCMATNNNERQQQHVDMRCVCC